MSNSVPSIDDREFNQFKSWIYNRAGINLTPAKKSLVAGRLYKRLKHHDIPSYGDYFKLIMDEGNKSELQWALDLLTTNETYFYREPNHFDFLVRTIVPAASASGHFRVWSAASSSGEEAYTIAMMLMESMGDGNWSVFGSDISEQILSHARRAQFPLAKARNLPESLLRKYCLKGVGNKEGFLMVQASLRSKVDFKNINLIEKIPNIGQFDVIFLRNVMIYFDTVTKQKVMQNLLPHLKPGGYFIISHSESLNGVCDALKLVSPSIYQK